MRKWVAQSTWPSERDFLKAAGPMSQRCTTTWSSACATAKSLSMANYSMKMGILSNKQNANS